MCGCLCGRNDGVMAGNLDPEEPSQGRRGLVWADLGIVVSLLAAAGMLWLILGLISSPWH